MHFVLLFGKCITTIPFKQPKKRNGSCTHSSKANNCTYATISDNESIHVMFLTNLLITVDWN